MINQVWLDRNSDIIIVALIGTVLGGIILSLLKLAINKESSINTIKRIPAFISKILNMKLVEILLFIATYIMPIVLFAYLLINYFNAIPTVPIVFLLIVVCCLITFVFVLKLVISVSANIRESTFTNFQLTINDIELMQKKIEMLEAKLKNMEKLS
ncbi:hypothetical protein Q1W71_23660 [Flavobacterium pectinovorum]|uniref:hypothetical protein n=1 Tax=Flavobacterium pectinovorum TaxID=29533 RepID=UPI0026603ADD|nr:hypothetical protein [Flavobacterium pectinovorum]WKL47932.1 hypothetical protein Q1W71_23660 [Flavobacterium pectinovorum]